MAYNHAKEELLFANHWAKLRDEYVQAGMSEDAIQAMYDFDREVFNGNRSYSEHTVRLLLEDEAEDEDEFAYAQALLNNNFSSFSVFDEYMCSSPYDWVELLDTASYVEAIRLLSDSDKELITLFAFHGFSINQLSAHFQQSRFVIFRRINKIKKVLKKPHI